MGKRALVLSGGGALGAFQVGVVRVAEQEYGYTWHVVVGVSVGALNGAQLAMGKSLDAVWLDIQPSDVYTGNLDLPHLLWALLWNRPSVLGNDPLEQRLLRDWQPELVTRIKFSVGLVSLHTRQYHNVEPSTFPQEVGARLILASTAMPIVWAPVDTGPFACSVDGGVRNTSPLGDVVDDEDVSEIVVVNCGSSAHLGESPCPASIPDIADNVLGVMLDEIFQGDIRQFVFVNSLVQQAEAKGVTLMHPSKFRPLRHVEIRIIEPFRPLAGGVLDFNQETILENIAIGEVSARMVLGTGD